MSKKLESFFKVVMKSYSWLVILISITFVGCTSIVDSKNFEDKWILWYDKPSDKDWNKALPVGNGRLSAMVFGNVKIERLQLNEDTIWSGKQNWRSPLTESAPQKYKQASKLLLENDFAQATQILQNEFVLNHKKLDRPLASYQTMGDLNLTFGNIIEETISSYRRELNLDTAIATTTFNFKGILYKREVFSSAVDNAIVVRLTSDKKSSIEVDIALIRPTGAVISYQDNNITLKGQAQRVMEKKSYKNIPPFDQSIKNNKDVNINQGVTFDTFVKIKNENGTLQTHNDKISIQGADTVTIYLTCGTDYWIKHFPNDPRGFNNSKAKAQKDLLAVVKKDYTQIKNDNIENHRELFRRVDINLGGKRMDNIATDVRLKKIITGYKKKQNVEDNDLIALYLQYGRYLLITSSRPNTMPANLQGIWSRHYLAPWSADYHININLQMNYWHAHALNLFECYSPYFDYIDRLSRSGAKTAREFYGARGWTSHHASDAWLYTYPIGLIRWGLFPYSAAWTTRHYWKHYRYTKDKKFLAERAYPIIKEASLFLLDILFEDPKTGRLLTGPSNSPENTFYAPGTKKKFTASTGTAMGQLITLETFENLIKIANVLGKQNNPVVLEAKKALDKIIFPKIAKDGRIQEWDNDYKEAEKGHRHISHLYSLYPASHFLEKENYRNAARKSIEFRSRHGGGHTGWSRAWIINFWARLKDANKAYENVIALLGKSTLYNLFDNHPPFQIDGNFGGSAGITEMLLQSHLSYQKDGLNNLSIIEILPALPAQWSNGYFKGFRTPDSHTIDLTWRNKKPKTLILSTLARNERRLFVFKLPKETKVKNIVDDKKQKLPWSIDKRDVISLDLPKEKSTISIHF